MPNPDRSKMTEAKLKQYRDSDRRRFQAHASSKRAMGLRRVSVWVPASRADELRELAKQMRVTAGAF